LIEIEVEGEQGLGTCPDADKGIGGRGNSLPGAGKGAKKKDLEGALDADFPLQNARPISSQKGGGRGKGRLEGSGS